MNIQMHRTMKTIRWHSLFLLGAALAVSSARALPLYEPFAYPPGANLTGQSPPGGRTWLSAGSGAEQPAVQAGNLPVPGLASATGERVRIRPGAGTSARLPFGGAVSAGTVYFSFAIKVADRSGLGTGMDFFAAFTPTDVAQANTPSNGFTRVFMRVAAGGYQLGLSKSTSAAGDIAWHPTTFTSNDTVFVVGSYTFTVGPGNDAARLWVNPSAGAFGSSDAPGPTLTVSVGPDANQLASIVLFQKPAPILPALLLVDELRLGETWSAVALAAAPARDFGDAPDSYRTSLASGGAYHPIVAGVYLGLAVDAEADGAPGGLADGDGTEEDGVLFAGPLTPGEPVIVTVIASTTGWLDAWVDFNRDGDFADGDEQVFSSEVLSLGPNERDITTPSTAREGPTFARFRFSTGGHLGYDGSAVDGEVEDYLVDISACDCPMVVPAGTDPLRTSWFTTYSGQYALVVTNDGGTPTNLWDAMTRPVFADVQSIRYSADYVYVSASGLSSYIMGPWYLNAGHTVLFPNLPLDQDLTARFPRHPQPAVVHSNTPLTEIGLYVNGSAIYNMKDGYAWAPAPANRDVQVGDGVGAWHRDAFFAEEVTWDPGNFHQPGSGQQHGHVNPLALRYQLGDNVDIQTSADGVVSYVEHTSGFHHSPIIGWAFDGHPLYGPYGYADPMDSGSTIRPMVSGYVLRDPADPDVAARKSLPLWAQYAQGRSSTLLTSPSDWGPPITRTDPPGTPPPTTYELGRYMEDYDYLGDLPASATAGLEWDLDRYNGRCCKTPEFPEGTYAYFLTLDGEGRPAFPYTLGPQYCGVVLGGTVTTIDESVTTVFDNIHDWGDAPDSYHTRAVSDGPWHRVVDGWRLGASVDAEDDGQETPSALGDDSAGTPDDENGVTFLTPIFPGTTAKLRVVAVVPAAGILNAWMDFNRDGDFADDGEHILEEQPVNSLEDTYEWPFAVPTGAVAGWTFARFRLSDVLGVSYDGAGGVGEVEDHSVVMGYDFGDAPEGPYHTRQSSGGAWHTLLPGFFLGYGVDAEFDGQPSSAADHDERTNEPDEDGVIFPPTPLLKGAGNLITVIASSAGVVDAWMDFNRSGGWQPGEKILNGWVVVPGPNVTNISVPLAAQDGLTYARFRFSGGGTASPDGPGFDGEVEDYAVSVMIPATDLHVGLSAVTEPVEGREFHYAIVVSNVSSTTATGVTVFSPTPANTTLLPAATPCVGTYIVDASGLTCQLGALSPSTTATLEVTVVPLQAGVLALEATASSDSGDLTPQDNTASASLPILPGRCDTPPTAISDFSIAAVSASEVAVEWLSQSGVAYRVEWIPALDSGTWTILTSVIGNGARMSVRDAVTEAARFYRVVAECHPVRLGSWGQRVKTSGTTTNLWRDDLPASVRALWETGQNFCIYPADEEADWLDLQLLLEQIEGTDFQVFAAIGAPHLGSRTSRWHESGFSASNCDCDLDTNTWDYAAVYTCQQSCLQAWLHSWTNAAATLSQLSTNYPNLAGMVINDFDGYVESVDFPACLFGDRLTFAQVQVIADAAHSANPDFGFWPTCYYQNFGRILGRGYLLGANYGVKLFSDEEMRVSLNFSLPADPAGLLLLKFFHADTKLECATAQEAYKQVYVNGTEVTNLVWSESVGGDQGTQLFELDVAAHLKAGENVIHLIFKPKSSNGCGSLFWRIWDVSLEGTVVFAMSGTPGCLLPVKLTAFAERFNTVSSTNEYFPGAGCPLTPAGTNAVRNTDFRSSTCLALPDDEQNGRAARRLIAAPNEAYLIHQLVDGIVAPFFSTQTYPADTELACATSTSGTYRPFAFDARVYAALLTAAKRQLGGAQLLALHLGADGVSDETPTLDLEVLEDQTETAAGIADCTGFWEAPLGVRFLEEQLGAFADRSVTGSSTLHAYFPGRQTTLGGWYQRWVSTPNLTGRRLTITVNSTTELSGMVRKIYAGTTTYHEADLASAAGGTSVTITVDTDPVVLAMELAGTSWHHDASVYFQVVDADDGTVYGADPQYWTFETGVNAKTLETYERERDVFLRIRRR